MLSRLRRWRRLSTPALCLGDPVRVQLRPGVEAILVLDLIQRDTRDGTWSATLVTPPVKEEWWPASLPPHFERGDL
jgi:hypothetical protein